MRAFTFEPSASCQFHDNPMPKSVVTSRRSLMRAKGHEKNVYTSIGRMRCTSFPKEAIDSPTPYDGMPYNSCHFSLPSVCRPASMVTSDPRGTDSTLFVVGNGLFGRMNDGVMPARTNHGFSS